MGCFEAKGFYLPRLGSFAHGTRWRECYKQQTQQDLLQQRQQAPVVTLGQFWGETSGVGILQTPYYHLLEQVLL